MTIVRNLSPLLALLLSAFQFTVACSSHERGGPGGGPSEAIRVAIHPSRVELTFGATQQFYADVTGANTSTVVWSVDDPHAGNVDTEGRFEASAKSGVFKVYARSTVDPTAIGEAIVVVKGENTDVVVAVDPSQAVTRVNETVQFRALVVGTDDSRVVWTVEEPEGGSITESGLYAAPSKPGRFTVVVTSVADPSQLAVGRIEVVDSEDPLPVTVRIEPALVEVAPKEVVEFSASVAGGSGTQGVTWSVPEEGGGLISSSGVYTAPELPGQFTVVATSLEDPKKSASARVLVVSPPDRTRLIPADRVTEWLPGLNAVGGVPRDDDRVRPSTVYLPSGDPFAGYSVDPSVAGSGGATRAIQDALDAAGAKASETGRKIVLLPSGEFRITGEGLEIPSFVTLRGQGTRGPGATRLVKAARTGTPVVILGHLWVKNTTPVDLAEDGVHGSKRIVVARDPGYRVGELVFIDQVEDTARVGSKWNPIRQGPGDDSRGWFSRQDRPTGQVVEIAAVDGNELTLNAPLRLPYYKSNGAQVVRFSGGRQGGPAVPTLQWSGLEDVYIFGGEQGNVAFYATSYAWAKNIESEGSIGPSVSFNSTFRSVLRDSFIHSTQDPNPGGAGYGIDLNFYSADNLIENNISWNFNKVITCRASGGGNVFGYNYVEDGWGAGYPTIPEVGLNASHYATPHHELFEGNQAWNMSGDSFWGNSIDITFFRNHATGRRRSVAPLRLNDEVSRHFVDVPEWHTGYSFVGNVLGTPDMEAKPQSAFVYENQPPWRYDPVPVWTIGPQYDSGLDGQDPDVAATTIRHGNFDYVTGGISWDPEIERTDLPRSMYLDSKPAFFGENPWPWVIPEDPGDTKVHVLPARARFDDLMGAR